MKGAEVKKIIKSLGVSQVYVAERMNITPLALHKILKAEDIKTGVLERIAKATDKDIFFFLGKPDLVRIPKVNEKDPELAKMVQTIHALVNYLTVFEK
ncbi:helix-turn-helix domain-containing protein [Gaoshiqia sp. Z1-71]|uniref:helix-turn-helix domain-containing protein n=1 Tax=Gaoshiqia hydrogeniformans TaxID=3290090 RepID=UPI003BF81E1D